MKNLLTQILKVLVLTLEIAVFISVMIIIVMFVLAAGYHIFLWSIIGGVAYTIFIVSLILALVIHKANESEGW